MINRVVFLVGLFILVACGGGGGGGGGSVSAPKKPAAAPSAPPAVVERPAYVDAAACTTRATAPPRSMMRTRQVLQTRHVELVESLSISKDDMLVTSSHSHTKVWGLRDRLLHRTLHERGPSGWSQDGKAVVVPKDGLNVEIDLDTLTNQPRNVTWVQRPWGTEARPGSYSPERPADQNLYVGALHANETHTIATAGTKHVAIWTWTSGKPEVVEIVPATSNERVTHVDVGLRGEQFVVALTSGVKKSRVALFTKTNSKWTSRDVVVASSEAISDLRVSPDGTLLLVVAEDLTMLDLPVGTIRWKKPPEKHRIGRGENSALGLDWSRAVFSPTSTNTLVASRSGGAIALLDTRTGRALGELGSEVRRTKNAFFTSATELVAASDEHLVFWSTTEGRVTRVETINDGIVDEVEASFVNGDILIDSVDEFGCGKGEEKHSFRRWIGTKAPPPPSPLEADDDLGADTKLKATKPATPLSWPPPRGASSICTPRKPLAMSLEKSVALVMDVADVGGSKQQGAYVIDLKTKKRISQLADYHLLVSRVLKFTADAAYVIGVKGIGANGSLTVWDARSGKVLKRDVQLTHPERAVEKGVDSFFMSPDGKRIGIVFHQQISLQSFPDLKETKKIQSPGGEPLGSALALDAEGGSWLFGWADGVFQRWDFSSGVAAKPASATGIEKLVLDPSKLVALAVTNDGAVSLWDAGTARLRATLASFEDDEWIAFTPAGAYVGTTEVSDRIGWVFGAPGPMEAFRFEQFDKTFRTPEMVRARLGGSTDDAPYVDARPPRVTLLRPPPAVTADDVVEVQLKASSDKRRVDAVRAYVDGRPVAAKAVCETEGLVTLKLPLMGGVNRVSIYAFDDHGYVSNPTTFDVTSSKIGKPNLFVITAGVSKYPKLKPEYQLDAADNDAKSIANAFKGQLRTFGSITQKLLLNEQVTPASLDEALTTLSTMKPDDVAVVFLAGHGVKVTKEGDMVFLTSSADSALKEGTIAWKQIGARLASAKGRVLVLLDACHSGDVVQEQLVPNAALATGLIQSERAGALVFAAAKGRQLSYEASSASPSKSRSLLLDTTKRPLVTIASDARAPHGYFTAAILNALESASSDRNGDGSLQVSELIEDVISRVTTASDGKQTPWVARREMFGDFSIARLR